MKIQKLLHSCLLIEDSGKRILIDPGHYSAELLAQIPKIDIVLITHTHGDHCHIPSIKKIVERDAPKVICNSEIVIALEKENITAQKIDIPQTVTEQGFTITSVTGNHELLPMPVPMNNGFYINKRLFHPGDCHAFPKDLGASPEILALPIAAPWGSVTRAVALARELKPKHVIPIHEGMLILAAQESFYQHCLNGFAGTSIKFHPLKPNEILEI